MSSSKKRIGLQAIFPIYSGNLSVKFWTNMFSLIAHIPGVCCPDMENVQNFTRAGLFISRFYPKVRELRQFQNRDKTA